MIWPRTRRQASWGTILQTPLLGKEHCSMRSQWTLFMPLGRLTLWSFAFRSRSTVPELKGLAPDAREPRAPILQQLMAASPHVLFRDPLVLQGQWHGTRCGHTIAHKHLREWLQSATCVLFLLTATPELFYAEQAVLIGFQSTHIAHTLAYRRGIWWCVACGVGPLQQPEI